MRIPWAAEKTRLGFSLYELRPKHCLPIVVVHTYDKLENARTNWEYICGTEAAVRLHINGYTMHISIYFLL